MFDSLPREIVDGIAEYLDIVSICRMSRTCKQWDSSLSWKKTEKIEKIPWRISAEYHFVGLDYCVHSVWIRIGWFNESQTEDCDLCSNKKWIRDDNDKLILPCSFSKEPTRFNFSSSEGTITEDYISSNNIKTVVVSGFGKSISSLFNNSPIIPIWFKVDYYRQTIIPYFIGDNIPSKINLYFTESRLIVGSLDTKSRSNFDKHRLNRQYIPSDPILSVDQSSLRIEGQIVRYTGISDRHLSMYESDDSDVDLFYDDEFYHPSKKVKVR